MLQISNIYFVRHQQNTYVFLCEIGQKWPTFKIESLGVLYIDCEIGVQ